MGKLDQTKREYDIREFTKSKIQETHNTSSTRMQHLKLGYYLICLSPSISLILWIVSALTYTFLIAPQNANELIFVIGHTGINLFVIGIQIAGLAFYYSGYKKGEMESKKSLFPLVMGSFLIILGLLATWYVFGWYNSLIEWSLEPYSRELTLWDQMEYATWMLNGPLWITPGIIFVSAAYVQRRKDKRKEKAKTAKKQLD